MFKRLWRAIRALFGKAVSAIEDPKLILEQNIRDLNDQVPRMNENIATVKANVIMMEKQVAKNQKEHDDLFSKIKAAIQSGRDDIAAGFAVRFESVKRELAESKEQLKVAQGAYDKALEVKKAFIREKDRKIAEAKEALRAHERSQWQKKIADTMQSFDVGGVDQTHDEMLTRLNEQTAQNEAKMEVALESVDTSTMKLEEDAEKIRAAELVKQMKLDMGIGTTTSSIETPAGDTTSEANKDKTT